MNYKIDLSEQNQNLLINADVKVEDREYSVDEIKKDIAEISSYIMSKSSKNGDIAKAQAEYMPLISVLQKNIIWEILSNERKIVIYRGGIICKYYL